jgi:putative drug exporter of the RND superfamily
MMGEAAWWLPAWLDKLLPHMDIEGGGELDDDGGEGDIPAPAAPVPPGPVFPAPVAH